MKKYYTRACNFYYGSLSKNLIKQKKALPLCGNNTIAFDSIELFKRENKKISSKIININYINLLSQKVQIKVKQDLNKISNKRKIFNDPAIMGVLNMTPDSFSDGGKYNKINKAYKRIKQMINSGAKIIDIGGESTRPGSLEITPSQEWKRIEKLVKNFKKSHGDYLVSIDTRKPEIIEKSIKYKVDIINDVSSFNYDKKTLNILKKYNGWKIIHHMQGTPKTMQINPKYKNVLLDIYDFFEKKILDLSSGKSSNKIILDPGIGFGKNLKHNLMLMSKISLFHSLGFPLLIGTSRKKFINQISGKYDTTERIGGTLSSVLYTLSQGVQIFRVHNVEEVKQGILVYKKILDQ